VLSPISPSSVVAARRALSRVTPEAAIDELHKLAAQSEVRTVLRERRGVGGPRRGFQCGGCRRLLSNRRHECPSCGFQEGRGYRR
jgi:hypothetical protein